MGNGDNPALPQSGIGDNYWVEFLAGQPVGVAALGMTKREEMAKFALLGILAGTNMPLTAAETAQDAVARADALLSELES